MLIRELIIGRIYQMPYTSRIVRYDGRYYENRRPIYSWHDVRKNENMLTNSCWPRSKFFKEASSIWQLRYGRVYGP